MAEMTGRKVGGGGAQGVGGGDMVADMTGRTGGGQGLGGAGFRGGAGWLTWWGTKHAGLCAFVFICVHASPRTSKCQTGTRRFTAHMLAGVSSVSTTLSSDLLA